MPATAKQTETLQKLGYTGDAATLTVSNASAIIGKLIADRKSKATDKQSETLQKLGYIGDISTLNFEDASVIIDKLITDRKAAITAAVENFKRSNSLDSIVQQYAGQQIVKHKIHCPLHADDWPSMHIYDDGGFTCFQCGAQGDILDFVGIYKFGTQYDRHTHFIEVVDSLDSIKIAPLPQHQNQPKPQPKKQLLLDLDTVLRWHENMPKKRREYWHSRHLTDNTIDRFMLGWDEKRYTIPHLYRLVPFGCKRRQSEINDGIDAKYTSVTGSRSGIFNADILLSVDGVVICEGEIDAMLLDQCGFPAISSTAGAGTWKEEWTNLFSGVRQIWIMYDNDEAGLEGARKVQASLRRAKIVQYPAGVKDAGELFDQTGVNPIKWLEKTLK